MINQLKFLSISAILLFSPITEILAQTTVLLNDSFDDNRNKWTQYTRSDNFLVDISNGVLHVEKYEINQVNHGCLWYKKVIPGFNTANDFHITFYARYLSGGDSFDGIDFQWGYQKRTGDTATDSLHQLNIFMNGAVRTDFFSKGWKNGVKKDISYILSNMEFDRSRFNKYEIIQHGTFLSLFINDNRVYDVSIQPVSGNIIGFQQCIKNAWEIDRIIIEQGHRENSDGLSSSLESDPNWKNWFSNYPETDIPTLLQSERQYADSVEGNLLTGQWYSRIAKCRFKAKYMGDIRPLNGEVDNSIRNVMKVNVGNTSQLDGLVDSEVLFKVANESIWMPVQKKILKALKKEVSVGDNVTLFCLFMNNHLADKKLFNTFLVSEFIKE